jgi:hypothetical protein
MMTSLGDDDDQHAARRVLDQGAGNRAAPPACSPAVQVLVAHDDEVGFDLARVLGDLVDRLAHQHFAAGGIARVGEAVKAVVEDGAVLLFLALLQFHVVHAAFQAHEAHGGGHDGDEEELGRAPLREILAIEQGLLPGVGAVVCEQDSFVHKALPCCGRHG